MLHRIFEDEQPFHFDSICSLACIFSDDFSLPPAQLGLDRKLLQRNWKLTR